MIDIGKTASHTERCNRLALQRLVEDAAADGLGIKAAIEIEWVVSAGDGDGLRFCGRRTRVRHDSADRRLGLRPRCIAALSAEGIAVEQFHPEYAAGQLELSVAAESPVDAADTSVLVRGTIRAVGPASTTTAPRSHPRWTPRALATAVMCTSACGGTAKI